MQINALGEKAKMSHMKMYNMELITGKTFLKTSFSQFSDSNVETIPNHRET